MFPLYNIDTGKPITTEDGGYITIKKTFTIPMNLLNTMFDVE